MTAFLAVALLMTGAAAETIEASTAASLASNPVRRVVTMLQSMQKKVEEEARKQLELFEKYECFCQNGGGTLSASIAAAETRAEELESSVKVAASEKGEAEEELERAKAERTATKNTMAKLTATRNTQAETFANFKATHEADIDALTQAIAFMTKGLGGSFLQEKEAENLRRVLSAHRHVLDSDVEGIVSFLSSGNSVSPGLDSSEILGMLKQIKERMEKDLAEATSNENAAIKEYDGLMAAKKREVNALSTSIEKHIARVGELAVTLARDNDDLEDARASIAEDKKFLANLAKTCELRKAEFEQQRKTRAEEVRALQETIKILNDDDALELFKKTLPNPASSFVQVADSTSRLRRSALRALQAQHKGKSHDSSLDFIALAIRGKKVGFGHVKEMINDMIENLKKSQVADETKKGWCESKIEINTEDKKYFERVIADTATEMEETKQTIATLREELQALNDGIAALDKSVAEATAQRKAEHDEHTQMLAQNMAAKQLLSVAKNRLQKFYNPKLHKEAAKKELSAEGRIFENHAEFLQLGERVSREADAPGPAPEAGTYKKKHEESSGVLAMIDLLVKDLDKEVQEAKVEEKNAQADYEETMSESSVKRAADLKSVNMKKKSEASLAEALQTLADHSASTAQKLAAKKEYLATLHEECDWLLEHFDSRKEARMSEIDSLGRAKAVLSGADYN